MTTVSTMKPTILAHNHLAPVVPWSSLRRAGVAMRRFSSTRAWLTWLTGLLAVAALGLAVELTAQQQPAAHECPAGQTETRPGNCQAPSQTPPSIVDYRPRSTPVTAQHPVPKAKFPAIDIHGHPPSLASNAASIVSALDALNVRIMV